MPLNIAIAGASGRMGRTLIEAVLRSADAKLAAALDITGSPHLGKDAGELIGAPCGVKITDDIERALKGCDAFIDFTRPEGTLHHVSVCRRLGVKPVIGTTGFNEAGKKSHCRCSQRNRDSDGAQLQRRRQCHLQVAGTCRQISW